MANGLTGIHFLRWGKIDRPCYQKAAKVVGLWGEKPNLFINDSQKWPIPAIEKTAAWKRK
jgi:hypothetical protein